jgi:hypothetical protein
MNDDELRETLSSWEAPEPNPQGAAKAWTAFERRRRPIWKGALEWRLNLPVPVAAVAALILLALGAWAGIALRHRNQPRDIVHVRDRIVPERVVVEKVVTREVIVRRKPRTYKSQDRPLTLNGFRPVNEITLEVIRRN